MSNKNKFFSALALGVVICAFSIAAFGQTEPARSQFSLYGLHFIGGGQTLSLTVLNPRLADPEIIPCVRVRIVFEIYALDGTTNKLRFVRRVAREVELDGGEAATFDFAASRSGDYVSPSVFARPAEETSPAPVRAGILSTLFVREGSRTILNLPAVVKGFDPQPDPPQ